MIKNTVHLQQELVLFLTNNFTEYGGKVVYENPDFLFCFKRLYLVYKKEDILEN